MTLLSTEDLLAGTQATHDVAVPEHLLASNDKGGGVVRLRPLSIGVFQLMMKAAKDDPGLMPLLMVKECLVEPKLGIQQVRELPVGLVEFLVGHIRAISGLTEKKTS
jgi:hypothetical protein